MLYIFPLDCSVGEFNCPVERECINGEALCDGIDDCIMTGFDESPALCGMLFRLSAYVNH